ncbi:hypothetical protein GCM10010169_34640 [Micromonospora fulviviridis]|nr:hypothetical protein GCM10010169_34640 [Micromonospora fulviviridis]
MEYTYSIPALFPDHEGGVALQGPAQVGALVPVEIPTGYDGRDGLHRDGHNWPRHGLTVATPGYRT